MYPCVSRELACCWLFRNRHCPSVGSLRVSPRTAIGCPAFEKTFSVSLSEFAFAHPTSGVILRTLCSCQKIFDSHSKYHKQKQTPCTRLQASFSHILFQGSERLSEPVTPEYTRGPYMYDVKGATKKKPWSASFFIPPTPHTAQFL